MKKIFLPLLLSLVFVQESVQAGTRASKHAHLKLGYANMTYILSLLPEYHKVESECNSYQNQLTNQLEKRILAFRKKAEEFSQVQATMAQAEKDKKAAELQQLHQGLQTADIEVQEKIVQKRATLLQPVYEKVQNTIAQVAKEHHYTYIFSNDARSPMLLYMPQEANISDLVLKKLGVSLEAKNKKTPKK